MYRGYAIPRQRLAFLAQAVLLGVTLVFWGPVLAVVIAVAMTANGMLDRMFPARASAFVSAALMAMLGVVLAILAAVGAVHGSAGEYLVVGLVAAAALAAIGRMS